MIRAGDACTTQLESRRLCLSMLFGVRNNQVHCEPQRTMEVADDLELGSHRECLPVMSLVFGPPRNGIFS
jgi:hypothetical protein